MAEAGEFVNAHLAPVPEERRMLIAPPPAEAGSPAAVDPASAAMVERYGLDTMLAARYMVHGDSILADNPINDKALNTILKLGGLESTGNTLMSGPSPLGKAAAIVLLESSTGAGGRGRTAAMSQAIRESVYNTELHGFNGLYEGFRKEQGVGIVSEAYSQGKVYKEFNRRVALEIEGRGYDATGETSPWVRKAADLWHNGVDLMRRDAQAIGTVGAAGLGPDSVGYFTHRMLPSSALKLTREQQGAVIGQYVRQFVDVNGFDEPFANKLAIQMLETARGKGQGAFPVSVNLNTPEGADMVEAAIGAMNIPAADKASLLGKFAKGGAGFTKRRLKLDLRADIPDGKGGTTKMVDLYDTDIVSLYRSYARRMSGEVALAQYGIMGKRGLSTLRTAIQAQGQGADQGALNRQLRALDQISAEMLNTPFGSCQHNWMDNARLMASNARLGGMGFTQFGEYGNGFAAVGVVRTFAAIKDLPRLIKEVGQLSKGGTAANPILNSIDPLFGDIGLESYHTQRIFDVKDNDIAIYGTETIGVATRAIRAGAHAQTIISGHRVITAVQTRGMAEQIVRKAVAYAKAGNEDAALASMGIDGDMLARLRAGLPHVATFDSAGRLSHLDLRASQQSATHIKELADAILRGASQSPIQKLLSNTSML